MDKYNSHTQWMNKQRAMKYPDALIECEICHRSFVKLGSHIVQTHKMTSREYKLMFGYPVKKGLVKGSFYEQQRSQNAVQKGVMEFTKKGREYIFKKGSEVASNNMKIAWGRKKERGLLKMKKI